MIESRPSDTFQPDTVLNNTYRIEGILGRGGTSEVYRARSEISHRVVAIKVLRAEFSGNEDYLLLMKREEEIRDIRHDAIVRYSENHRTPEGHVYLIMDFVDGPGLDERLHAGGLPADDLMTICARLADGLYVAHSRNIVHRDLSPDNIILRNGNPTEAVIIDFGIAKDSNPGAGTIVGNEFAGKYAYAAPEQLNGTSDARSDIYSLGALLLATFRGETPNIGRNPMEVIAKKNEPLDTEGVPEPLKS
ncbi:MAG: serine/threonine-protein kinase, partial [Pseudomonadota bacterium]